MSTAGGLTSPPWTTSKLPGVAPGVSEVVVTETVFPVPAAPFVTPPNVICTAAPAAIERPPNSVHADVSVAACTGVAHPPTPWPPTTTDAPLYAAKPVPDGNVTKIWL